MAFLHVISRQPTGRARAVSPEHQGYDNFADGGSGNSGNLAMYDFDGKSLTEADMQYKSLRGCEELEEADRIYIRQRMPVDLKAGCGAGNTYNIQDQNGRTLFRAEEDRNCFCRWCCGPHRSYHITLYNAREEAVLHLDRSCCRCDWCCCVDCCFCQHTLNIRDWRGEIIGKARQRFHVFHLKMDVMDADDAPFCRIKGPCCPCRCCTEMNFDIVTLHNKKPVGYVAKRFAGYREDFNVDHENFEIYYPHGLNISQKATLLGAGFLVNFMYFEMS